MPVCGGVSWPHGSGDRQDAEGLQGPNEGPRLGEVLHGAARGVVGAMAMTGMRVLTTELGLVEQTPAAGHNRIRASPLR